MAKTELADLLAQLDEETRRRWAHVLEEVDAEVAEQGPAAARQHLEKALEHLLAVGWTLHRCYAPSETTEVIGPLGDVAGTIEKLRAALDQIRKKPEWSH